MSHRRICVAGVSDVEEAQGLLDFARRFEIIRKDVLSKLSLSEVDFADEESIAAAIPKSVPAIQLHAWPFRRHAANAALILSLCLNDAACCSQEGSENCGGFGGHPWQATH